MSDDPRQLLRAMFDAAVGAAHPSVCLPPYLEKIAPPKGRTIVVGAGKAAASMAAAVEAHWKGGPLEGLVVTRYEHGAPTSQIEVIEASHPVPDAAGREAAKRILQKVQGLTEDDLVLALISGGGSALMALPAEGVTLEEKQAVNKALLKSGANISEMNCVRKHLSAIKGGRLARAAAPARVVALMISDVPNDDLSVIASGPTVPDPTTREDALAVIAKYKIDAPTAVLDASVESAIARRPSPATPSSTGWRTSSSRRRRARWTRPPRWRAAPASRPASSAISKASRATWRWCMPASPSRSPFMASPSFRPSPSSPAARRPSPCAAMARAGATRSSCSA